MAKEEEAVIIHTGGAHFISGLKMCKTINQLNHFWSTVPDDFKFF